MFRKTLTIFSLLGLLLSIGLWGFSTFYAIAHIPRSLRYRMNVYWGVIRVTWPDRPYYLITEEHALAMLAETGIDIRSEDWTPAFIGVAYATPGLAIDREEPELGYGFRLPNIRHSQSYPLSPYYISIPMWIPFSLFAAFSYWSVAPVWRRRRRRRHGQCAECGYDLRGSTICCSECGTPLEGDITKGGVR